MKGSFDFRAFVLQIHKCIAGLECKFSLLLIDQRRWVCMQYDKRCTGGFLRTCLYILVTSKESSMWVTLEPSPIQWFPNVFFSEGNWRKSETLDNFLSSMSLIATRIIPKNSAIQASMHVNLCQKYHLSNFILPMHRIYHRNNLWLWW